MLLLLLYSASCAGRATAETGKKINDTTTAARFSIHDLPEPGKIIDHVVCIADPSQSYALYIPVKGNNNALPIIYFFDPHGDGALPLRKYKLLADEYGFILAGSNNSKNGNDWAAAENTWRNLSGDTKSRLKINGNRVYTCGFSGGAKVAGYVALNHPGIKAVIANGAGLPDGTLAGNFNFSFTAIAGEGDMNLTDLVAFSNELDKTRTRHHLLLFEGKHEWAPLNCMSIAFEGLQLDAMQQALVPKDDAFINRYIAKSKQRLDGEHNSNQLVKAGREYKLSISFLDGLSNDATWFKTKAASLAGKAQYQQQLQAQENILAKEENTKSEYMQHFQQGDMHYWTTTIGDLQTRAHAKTAETGMNQRLLAYLSLAFYSISNHLLGSNENSAARHFVELYKMADPANSEAWYFSAMLHAREKQVQAAETDLLKAVDAGFRDKSRMEQQPEFQTPPARLNFSKIESKMAAKGH